MKQNNNLLKFNHKHNSKSCGAITCINNVCGTCIKDKKDKCELYENVLIQEY